MTLSHEKRRVFLNSLRIGLMFMPLGIFVSMFEFGLPIKLQSIQSNLSIVGFFISFSWFITTFLDFAWGYVIDRIGKKKGIAIGILAFGIFTFLFAFTNNIYLLLLFNTIAYVGYDIFYIGIYGYLITTAPHKEFNYVSSGFYPLWNLGFTIGPVIAAILIMVYSPRYIYFSAILLCAATLAMVYSKKGKIKSETPEHMHYSKSRFSFADSLSYFRYIFKEDRWILLGIMFCTFWYSIMTVGIPLLFVIEEDSVWMSAAVMVAFIFPFIFTDLFAGFLGTNRHKRFIMITAGFVIGSAALLVFFLSHNFVVMAAAALICTFGINFSWAIFDIEAGLLAEKGKEARIESAFTFAKNIGWDAGPFFFGIIAQAYGIRFPFFILSVVFAAMFLVFIFKHVKVK